MDHPLRALQRVLEHEAALYGTHLPLGVPEEVPVFAEPETTADIPTEPPARAKQAPPAQEKTPPAEAEPSAEAKPLPPVSQEASVDPMANLDLFGQKLDPSQDPSRPPWERIDALIPKDSPLHGMTTLEQVRDYVNHTVLVPIDEARLNAVMGVGDPTADLVIIGEAPGADEDRTGEPFTGRAGQLLNKILAAIHFEREDVYITNILKSRPPNNRDPVPAEVEAHLPILYKQLVLIKPRIILCVGKTAGNSLLGRRSSLGALRDKFHDYYGLPLMVTYHPAALLRNPQWKRPTWEDMKLLRTRYDQLVNT